MKEHTIDAQSQSIGRVASQAAVLLMGKNDTTYRRNVAPEVKVRIINAAEMHVPTKKMNEKIYKSYSGYPGGLKEVAMQKVVDKKGYGEVVRHAVRGMLPDNKLRSIMMKNLTISE